jgi:hypothetical protein
MSHLHEPLKGIQLVALRDALASSLREIEGLLGSTVTTPTSTTAKVLYPYMYSDTLLHTYQCTLRCGTYVR